jgi:hypothetical protein
MDVNIGIILDNNPIDLVEIGPGGSYDSSPWGARSPPENAFDGNFSKFI